MNRKECVSFFYDVCDTDVDSKQGVLLEWAMWLDVLDEDGEDVDITWALTEQEVAEILKLRQSTPLPKQYLKIENSYNIVIPVTVED